MLPDVHTPLTELPGSWCSICAALLKVHLLNSPAVGCHLPVSPRLACR